MKTLVIGMLTAIIGMSLSASAETVALGAGVAYSELKTWSQSLQNRVECREVQDVPGTYLCLTAEGASLASLMGRVSYYVEGAPARSIVAEINPTYQSSEQRAYGGHDIMASDIEEFYARLDQACLSPAKICANELESSLRNTVMKDAHTRGYKNYAVIATAVDKSYVGHIISHEMYHARFFLNPSYQTIVAQFWTTKVSAEDQNAIIGILSQIYNFAGPNGTSLLLNEFQAFTLEEKATEDLLSVFAKRYSEDLRRSLGSLVPAVEPTF